VRLKSLELQGFKTFASQADFVFPTGVTAIVGPNGSGKSNIADAIRWVLGEQSFSVLRGKRTEDMIFAGSESRPRAGMAQVFLTFDNSDNWLPVEFAEVTIGRRATRDGQNEYLLNGNRVRLRDIMEMLGQSGLARRTYAVIGQGLVDQALSLRPEERRALFEEAAGISMYQSKREDALRKLEETNRNLERARDILAEIAPRLRSLQRQADRSQQYARLIGELRDMQRVWYGYHWGRAQDSLRAARLTAEAQAAQLARQQAELDALAQQLARVREQQSALRAQVTTWQRQANSLRAQTEATRRELAVLGERDRLLEAQRAELESSTAALQAQRAEQATRLEQAKTQLETLRQAAADRTCGIAQAQQAVREREKERAQINAQRAQTQKHIAHLAGQITDRRNRHAQLAERQAEIQREQAAHQTELAQLEKELAEQNQTIQRVQADITALEDREAQLKAQLAECAAQIAASQQRQAELDEKLAQARAAEMAVSARAEALGKVRTELGDYSAGAQAVINARIAGVRGALVTQLAAPDEWERAIEAALGADVQALIADTWEAVSAARQRLGNAGRATLVAIDLLEEKTQRAAAMPRPGFWQRVLTRLGVWPKAVADAHLPGVQRASAVVTCDPAIQPVVQALLGNTLLVADLEAARAIASALKPGEQIVTRAGDVLRANGTITLGSEGAGKGLLAREREWRALPAQLAAAQKHAVELQMRRDHEAAHQLELVNQQTALRRATDELAGQIRQRITERETLRRTAERLEQQTKWETNRIAQLQTEFESVQAKDATLATEAQALLAQQKSAEEGIAACETKLAALPLEELTHQITTLQTAAAVAEQAVQGQQAVLKGQQNALAQLDAQLGERAGRVAQLARERFNLQAQLESLRLKDNQSAGGLAELDARIQPAEAQLDQLELARNSTDAAESAARVSIREYEARHSAAALEVSRRQGEIDALRARIEEDLGLVELPMGEEVTAPMPLPLRPVIEELPTVQELPEGLEDSIQRRKAALHRLGPINAEAQTEYQETLERHTFLTTQCADLEQAITSLHQVIAELDELMRQSFIKTFDAIAAEFKGTFARLFGGGSAKMILTDPENIMLTGIDIVARPPGKRQQGLALLSGGERTLTAAALLFAILKVRPTPFCVLDEVDAALDESNVVRFREMLKELAANSQFVLITHNRGTIEAADTIYGITMGADHASQVLSYKLDGEVKLEYGANP
jgi:chromosome segregation protein